MIPYKSKTDRHAPLLRQFLTKNKLTLKYRNVQSSASLTWTVKSMLKSWCRKAVCAIQTASNVSKYYLPTAFAPSSAIPSFISSPASIYPQNLYISLTQKHSISCQTPISIYIDHKLHKKQSGGRLKYFLIVVCDRGLCIKVVLCGQSSLSSKANVLCSICTNTVFSITYL